VLSPIGQALLAKTKTDPETNHNRVLVHNLLVMESWGMELSEEDDAAIDEYIILYGNPTAQPPQGVIKAPSLRQR
jgi:hypothetical protein